MQKPILIANWKANRSLEETQAFIQKMTAFAPDTLLLALPLTPLEVANHELSSSGVIFGANFMSDVSEDDFTASVAGELLTDAGARFVILGDSEKRRFFGETDANIRKKIELALKIDITPVVCIGGELEDQLKDQIEGSLSGFSQEQLTKVILVYEHPKAAFSSLGFSIKECREARETCLEVATEVLGENAMRVLCAVSPDMPNLFELLQQGDSFYISQAAVFTKQLEDIVEESQAPLPVVEELEAEEIEEEKVVVVEAPPPPEEKKPEPIIAEPIVAETKIEEIEEEEIAIEESTGGFAGTGPFAAPRPPLEQEEPS